MSLSKKERDKAQEEKRITSLVNEVRNDESEDAFIKLRAYLDNYIKLFGRRYRIPGCDFDEIEQECLYALRFKAIADFNKKRGKFRSFAILCIKRHLFSLIKSSKQQKRRVQNESLSLDEDRSEGENLSLGNLLTGDDPTAAEQMEYSEDIMLKQRKLLAKLSRLEQEVLRLYLLRYSYEEIVEELQEINARDKFTERGINKKTIDNATQRIKSKSRILAKILDWT